MNDLIDKLREAIFSPKKFKPKYELRWSNQPYCPRKHFIFSSLEKAGLLPESELPIDLDRIFTRGHIMHKLIQTRLIEGTFDFKFLGEVIYNAEGEPEYKEFSFEDIVSGHADGLIEYLGKYYVLEVKSSEFRLPILPYKNHIVQATGYGHEFTHKLNYPVVGIIFLYVYLDYENLSLEHRFFEVAYDERIYHSYIALVNYGLESLNNGIMPGGICDTISKTYDCVFGDKCREISRSPYLDCDEAVKNVISFIYLPNKLATVGLRNLACRQ